MEKDEIIIRAAVMHILNTYNSQLEFSDTLLDLTQDTCDFLRNHIYRIMESDDTKECTFTEDSEIGQMIDAFEEDNLIMDSQMLAYKLYELMITNSEIPPADLFTVTFQVEGYKYLAILKMNYKETYIHRIEKYDTGISNKITKQKYTLPSMSAKLTEAAVINFDTLTIDLIEKKCDINGIKAHYFSSMFLQCNPKISNKSKLNIVNRAMDQIKRKHYPEDPTKIMKYKSLLYQSNLDGEIIPEDIAFELFPEEPEIKQEFLEKLERYDIVKEPITPKKATTIKKFERQQLTTDQGIEITIPMEQYLNTDSMSIINKPDGTIEVTIKNINFISSR
jgi:hypothetical protein